MLPCSMKSYDRSYDLSGLNTSKNRAFLSFVEKIVNEKLNSKESQSLSMDNKEEIIRQLLNIVKINDIDDDILSMQLKFLLILSRSRDNIELLSRSSILEMLQENAGLDLTTRDSSLIKSQSILASLKTIANLIFQSGIVQKFYE
ncbi:hypothetical protein GJ496_002298 [Pomphorhynchus laevis]|nr:hypothetical protein GJ496_002298 [Pomphorhynchus laevis]